MRRVTLEVDDHGPALDAPPALASHLTPACARDPGEGSTGGAPATSIDAPWAAVETGRLAQRRVGRPCERV
jgi:hypothetical protein